MRSEYCKFYQVYFSSFLKRFFSSGCGCFLQKNSAFASPFICAWLFCFRYEYWTNLQKNSRENFHLHFHRIFYPFFAFFALFLRRIFRDLWYVYKWERNMGCGVGCGIFCLSPLANGFVGAFVRSFVRSKLAFYILIRFRNQNLKAIPLNPRFLEIKSGRFEV